MKAKEVELGEYPLDKMAGLASDCMTWGAKVCINKDCESIFPRNHESCPLCSMKQELDEGTKKHKVLLDNFLSQ